MKTNKEYDKLNASLWLALTERDEARAEVEKLRVLLSSIATAYDSGYKAGIAALKRLVAAADGSVCPPDGDDVGAMLEYGEAMDAARAAIRGDV